MVRSPACPACARPLVVFELEGIAVDRCLACGGTWLDEGELALIAERAGLPRGETTAPKEPARGTPGARRCPRCRGALEIIPASRDAQGSVELDRCPRGDGLWFDARELERTLAADHGDAARALAAFLSKLFGPVHEH